MNERDKLKFRCSYSRYLSELPLASINSLIWNHVSCLVKSNSRMCVQFPTSCIQIKAALMMSLYGLRDAPKAFEFRLRQAFLAAGYTTGVFSACCYCLKKLRCTYVVHGDDFVGVGPKKQAEEFWSSKRGGQACRQSCSVEWRPWSSGPTAQEWPGKMQSKASCV